MSIEKFTERDGYEYGEGPGVRDDTGKFDLVWYRRPIPQGWEQVPEAEVGALTDAWTQPGLRRFLGRPQ